MVSAIDCLHIIRRQPDIRGEDCPAYMIEAVRRPQDAASNRRPRTAAASFSASSLVPLRNPTILLPRNDWDHPAPALVIVPRHTRTPTTTPLRLPHTPLPDNRPNPPPNPLTLHKHNQAGWLRLLLTITLTIGNGSIRTATSYGTGADARRPRSANRPPEPSSGRRRRSRAVTGAGDRFRGLRPLGTIACTCGGDCGERQYGNPHGTISTPATRPAQGSPRLRNSPITPPPNQYSQHLDPPPTNRSQPPQPTDSHPYPRSDAPSTLPPDPEPIQYTYHLLSAATV